MYEKSSKNETHDFLLQTCMTFFLMNTKEV